jgi:hypothetical protein
MLFSVMVPTDSRASQPSAQDHTAFRPDLINWTFDLIDSKARTVNEGANEI